MQVANRGSLGRRRVSRIDGGQVADAERRDLRERRSNEQPSAPNGVGERPPREQKAGSGEREAADRRPTPRSKVFLETPRGRPPPAASVFLAREDS